MIFFFLGDILIIAGCTYIISIFYSQYSTFFFPPLDYKGLCGATLIWLDSLKFNARFCNKPYNISIFFIVHYYDYIWELWTSLNIYICSTSSTKEIIVNTPLKLWFPISIFAFLYFRSTLLYLCIPLNFLWVRHVSIAK